jgi:hypothetical protein
MRRCLPFLAGVGVLFVACETEPRLPTQPTSGSIATSKAAQSQQGHPHGHAFRAFRRAEGSGSDNSTILYHGGPVIHSQKVAVIYWSNSTIYNGGPAPGTTGPGSADGSLVGFFLNHLGGSPYYTINTTYNDDLGDVQNSVTYTQFWASNTSVPSPNSNVPIAAIETELEAGFTSGALTVDPSTVYLVFTDAGVNQDNLFPLNCGEHVNFTWNGNDVKFAAMPRDYDQNGCRQGDYLPGAGSPNNDPVADAEVNLIAHETEETSTDPDGNGWYDVVNDTIFENADKCKWQFGSVYTTANLARANMNLGGKDFLIQENWFSGGGFQCQQAALATSISGPSQVQPYTLCYWNGSASGGTAPYSYYWNGYGPTSPRIGISNGGSDFSVVLTVTDSRGVPGFASQYVRVYQYGQPCG